MDQWVMEWVWEELAWQGCWGQGQGQVPSLFHFERLNVSVRAEEDLSGRQPSKVVSLQRDPW